jgi:hypothetical protein
LLNHRCSPRGRKCASHARIYSSPVISCSCKPYGYPEGINALSSSLAHRPCARRNVCPKSGPKASTPHQKVSSRPALPSTHLASAATLVALVPVIYLSPDAFTIAFVLVTGFQQQLRAVARTTEVSLEVLPSAVGLEGAVWVRTPIRS